jgi:hypothetical protein
VSLVVVIIVVIVVVVVVVVLGENQSFTFIDVHRPLCQAEQEQVCPRLFQQQRLVHR